ncbi:hypothetical protein B0186_01985 [Canicola haemoglobinophilus]|uniref:Uncharacterized protein n=1 Tax=Canicola haemoglobinophilus TaxID=733 RepID=A0A1V4B3D9_9PAST|nr:hypothetical protein [Canicola haemoglobinophilus]OOS01841.1 hypothetical protein B0186_01985 [Canicola haemoglobinophilus]STO53828.1 Uncharacterised protein [Canicola haemoglobinophilus]STO60738.1 Uncharacterised protein [Canicola haemoglobinophilus]STO68361.1 Uncharacterised protein [Canicola haemoglobinophilus]
MKNKVFKLTFLAGAISTAFSSHLYAEIGTSISDKINAAQNGGNNVVTVINAGELVIYPLKKLAMEKIFI